MQLPEEFIQQTKAMMGDELFHTFLSGLNEEPSVSIRLNPKKNPNTNHQHPTSITQQFESVPWCPEGYYLNERPTFTFDPMFHAGVYYVQEASSMFITHALNTILLTLNPQPSTLNPQPSTLNPQPIVLDLCAAPGGKSTCALSTLPENSILFSNEPIGKRAQILSENIQKWLMSTDSNIESIVTCNYAKDYKKAKMLFDIVIADVPCSGEGMFRKDPKAIEEWSLQNVEKCWRLQRDIVQDIWSCLKSGGFLIYSTCTFNTHEDEENVQWIVEELGADIIEVPICEEWHITGSLLPSFNGPVYRFLPGKTRGEGLFMAVLRKHGEWVPTTEKERNTLVRRSQQLHILPHQHLLTIQEAKDAPRVPLTYEQAIAYLRHEAIVLPADTPRGIVMVCYCDLPLGLAKNIGNRANNLYPKEWRIKSTHIPTDL